MKNFSNSLNFWFIGVASLLMVIGCNINSADKFYTDYGIEDLWRLPLIKPYVLLTVAGSRDFEKPGWNLDFKDSVEINGSYYKWINVNQVNVVDSIIYGFGNSHPSFPFIINLNLGTQTLFINKTDWEIALKKLKITDRKLYDAFEVFENFKNKGTLPWRIPSQ